MIKRKSTLACCFECAYCGSRGGKPRENELTTAECVNVAHSLYNLGCRRVSLIGGEVFMRSDWEIIVNALVSRNILKYFDLRDYKRIFNK